MKFSSLIFIGLVILYSIDFAAEKKYVLISPTVDFIIKQEKGIIDTLRFREIDSPVIPFHCQNPKKTLLQLEDAECQDSLYFILINQTDHIKSPVIGVANGEQISVKDCFQNISRSSKSQKKGIDFRAIFKELRRTPITCRPSPILKGGGENPSGDEPKLSFIEADYVYYFDMESLSVEFAAYEAYPIKSLYLISDTGQLLTCAGDPSLVASIIDLSDKLIPPICEVLSKRKTEKEKQVYFTLSSQKLKSYLYDSLKTGQWYQVGVELYQDTSKFNPYLFNFQLLNPIEQKILKGQEHE